MRNWKKKNAEEEERNKIQELVKKQKAEIEI